MSLLDREDLVGSLFFPRADARACPAGARDHMVDVRGATLHLRVHGDRGPIVLLFHGNGEIVSDWDGAAPSFLARGARFGVLDYRAYGRSTGTPTMRAVLDDAWTVLAYVHALAGSTVIVMGRSLGSAAAWEVASASCVRAVIVDSGFTSVDAFARRRGVDPTTLEVSERARLDPIAKIARVTAPTLLLHGEDDSVIVHGEAERALASIPHARKSLATIAGRGHNDLAMDPAYWRALGPFLDALR
ncbi:MAG: alpha/beta hydrolase [Deltaproteobacteria bacterium]|nr:alpha/beta hydrolase [Deltaproteobacteria bacterium]